jgi:hypothetical protein
VAEMAVRGLIVEFHSLSTSMHILNNILSLLTGGGHYGGGGGYGAFSLS